jgi:hypothetical protein
MSEVYTMATSEDRRSYDTSIGSEQRSVVSATKIWVIVLGFVLLIGIVLILTFFNASPTTGGNSSSGAANATSRSPGP